MISPVCNLLRKKELETLSDIELTKYRNICKLGAASLLSNREQSLEDLEIISEILISRGYMIEKNVVKFEVKLDGLSDIDQ